MTSQPTEPNHIQQTLFAEDFHVPTSQSLEGVRASRKLRGLVSGSNSSEPYAWYDQSTSSWKTCQRSLLTEWTSFSGTFTRQGYMNANGAVFQARLLELAIKEIDGGCSEKLPTPTTMDGKEESMKHATKMLQGKTHRASGQPIQKTLSDKVMMEMILENPELMQIYQDHQMEERPLLPSQEEFVNYLREQTTIKQLTEKTTIKKTTIEHWFRRDKKGFSYPSIENWEKIKPHLKKIKFDKEMTTVQSKEWTTKDQLLPTPTASDPDRKAKYKQGGTPLRAAIDQEILPTPRAAIGMGMKLSKGMANLEHKKYLETEIAAKVHTHGEVQNTDSTQTGENMYLNPQFVEEMMGYPLNWTLNNEFKD